MMIVEHFIYDDSAKTWNLYPFGDLQFGASGFREDLWNTFKNDVLKDRDALTVGCGDYTDLFRPTIQGRFEGALAGNKDAAIQLEDLHKDHMHKIIDKLKTVVRKDNCLGLLGGHHDMDYRSGITSTQYLCENLGVKYLGRSAIILVKFRPRSYFRNLGKHGTSKVLKIHAQHGSGGSSYVSSDLANLERKTMPYYNADIYLRGHSTKKSIAKTIEYDASEGSPPYLIEREKVLINTGGFMSGYEEGTGASYVEKQNMAPASLGWVKLAIKINDTTHNKRNLKTGHKQLKAFEFYPTMY